MESLRAVKLCESAMRALSLGPSKKINGKGTGIFHSHFTDQKPRAEFSSNNL